MKRFIVSPFVFLTLSILFGYVLHGCGSYESGYLGVPISPSPFLQLDMGTAPSETATLPPSEAFNTEQYDRIYENPFRSALENPLSTFSIDVDTASYANVRRFIRQMNQLPPKDAVRIEEMVNYFTYDDPQPTGETPFAVTTEVAGCPWNASHRLVRIGIQGKAVPMADIPPMNLVFLIDVSGSMSAWNKLPLLKKAFRMLVGQMRERDRIAMVVYAGAAGLVLESTPGSEKAKILAALERLESGGSTAGAAGIQLAYTVAKANFISNGNNRVILATDGDFNVGPSSDGALVRMIEERRNDGVFLTVLGFGMGNYKDAKMERLANKGNGNYAYIDGPLEAKKVLVKEIGGTLMTIAKDVKIQVEFNPARIKAYRLIGYENRLLANEDFDDDAKDAGELGAGHTVTALYELVPVGADTPVPGTTGELKYQTRGMKPEASASDEMMTVKLRYKMPDGDTSRLIVDTVKEAERDFNAASENFRFAAGVAGFGMILRDSGYKGDLNYADVLAMAKGARGTDENGLRAEFIRLVEAAELLER